MKATDLGFQTAWHLFLSWDAAVVEMGTGRKCQRVTPSIVNRLLLALFVAFLPRDCRSRQQTLWQSKGLSLFFYKAHVSLAVR